MRAVLSGVVVLLAAVGCRTNTGPTEHIVVLSVDKLDAPATIASTSPLDVVLTVVSGACQTFTRIEAERGATSVKLTALGKDPEKGCIDLGLIQPRTYRLEPPFTPGTFTISVDRGRLSPLIATVQVQ